MKILKVIGSILFVIFALGIFLIFYFIPPTNPATCNQIDCTNCLTEKQLAGQFNRTSIRGFTDHKYYKCVDCQTDGDCKDGFKCNENKCDINN